MSEKRLHFWMAPGRLQQDLIQNLMLIEDMGLVASAHLYAPAGMAHWYLKGWTSLAAQRPDADTASLIIDRGINVERGNVIRLAMDLSRFTTLHPDTDHVLVSPHRSAVAIIDWVSRHSDARIQYLPKLSQSQLGEFIGQSPERIDRLAVATLEKLGKQYRGRPVAMSLWADSMIARVPALSDRRARKLLLGTARFSDYARLLGIDVSDDRIHTRSKAKPRPTVADLVAVQRSLVQDGTSCLFLHWANAVLAKFPVLQEPRFRMMLFGEQDMERLAALCGLKRRKQLLISGAQTHAINGELSHAR